MKISSHRSKVLIILLCVGFFASIAMLGKIGINATFDFHKKALLLWLGIAVLWVQMAKNTFSLRLQDPIPYPLPHWKQGVLLSAIPLAFFGASLGCSGWGLQGCTPICTFIKIGITPLIAFACLVYFIEQRKEYLIAISLLSFVSLWPHCICYNMGNDWWIDRFGKSPECFTFGFVTTQLGLMVLCRGYWYWLAVGLSWLIVLGTVGFHVSHHYYHFPW